MLRVAGNQKRTCAGSSRREMLVAGGLQGLAAGMAGLTGQWAGSSPVFAAPAALQSESLSQRGPGKAKSVICLFLFGGWSQLETFDMKPGAPSEIRGPYRSINSTVPGLQVCEHLPLLSQRMHQLALIRSVNSPDANHNTCMILTGHDGTVSGTATKAFNPGIPRDRPYFMSALQYLRDREGITGNSSQLPQQMCVPNRLGLLEGYYRTGPYGGLLGSRYDPICTQFGRNGEKLFQPGGVAAETLSLLPDGAALGPEMTLNRLDRRKDLLEQLEAERRRLMTAPAIGRYSYREQQVLQMLTSDAVKTALNLQQESMELRNSYGWNLFGQSVLLSRRLVEHGVPLVTAIWDCTKEGPDIAGLGWDTHWDHFKACDGWLLPGVDRAISALHDDMSARGMLDETLVVVLSEMGRTPQINSRAGRDHWVGTYCALMAGAGIQPGAVYGASDSTASYVADSPVSPQDLLATIYHLTGFGPETLVYDNQNRPSSLYGEGQAIRGILL